MSDFIQCIKRYIPVSKQLESALKVNFYMKHFQKKETFIREGQFNVPLAYIQTGIMRCVKRGVEKDIINEFYFEDRFVTDYQGFYDGTAAKQEIDTITEVTLNVISRDRLFKLAEDFPELKLWGEKTTKELFTNSLQQNMKLKSESPEETYKRLMTDSQKMFNKIPLGQISSYLGITQTHLSRIRSKLRTK